MTPMEEMVELLTKLDAAIDTVKTTDIDLFEVEDMFKLSKKSAELSQLVLNVASELVDMNDNQ